MHTRHTRQLRTLLGGVGRWVRRRGMRSRARQISNGVDSSLRKTSPHHTVARERLQSGMATSFNSTWPYLTGGALQWHTRQQRPKPPKRQAAQHCSSDPVQCTTEARRHPARKHTGRVLLPLTPLLLPLDVRARFVVVYKHGIRAARCRRACDTRHRTMSSALSPHVSTGWLDTTASKWCRCRVHPSQVGVDAGGDIIVAWLSQCRQRAATMPTAAQRALPQPSHRCRRCGHARTPSCAQRVGTLAQLQRWLLAPTGSTVLVPAVYRYR